MSDGSEVQTSVCERVFNTAELLDLILDHLLRSREDHDGQVLRWTFNLQRINKTFYSHLRGSTSTAGELYLAPKPQQTIRTFLMKEHGFFISQWQTRLLCSWRSGYVRHRRNHCLIRFRISNHEAFADIPSYGDMYLAQPPVTDIWMQGMGFCGTAGIAGKYLPLHLKPMLLSRPGGIKVMDVLESAKSLLRRFGGRAERENVFFWARLDENGRLWSLESRFKPETRCFLPECLK